ncbi:MAG: lipopolysaccharide biosynthesis protein [Dysgonamonadaceae bacterium]|jgi:O-antigen/teichoic acid export membrane protein|nr:lipopolysaccharide biosynthesis protein [Dysgonamonadaceae bacterium]MDD3356674.1 lipopolysaccharide biosynthesis protein [Dysgonamonadaceae bacterium]MDD3726824.1 lipopolysaccharide biosynthesis protein [Dysgonamonadaceae bacterium]MDD4245816.1 lipopolysaccharide biosynthesis protein [Dysgonamonadaceae bacterium]MDD4606641.1 lipopolysaccharide biosynthesis protein [Dysgonamonadaceae bacterium]
MPDSTLKKRTVTALFWSFLDKFGQKLIFLISSVFLMRLLDISAYGIMGSLLIFTAISSLLIDSGFGRALLNRKHISAVEYSTVFYFNLAISAFLYIALFLSAPLIAQLFHEPMLIPVSRVLFLSLLFNGLSVIQTVIFTKASDFKTQTKANTSALVISTAIALIMAWKGFGVWSLVAQNVIYAFFRSLFLWLYSPWRPKWIFKMSKLKTFFAFSNKLLASGAIGAIFNNIYPSVIAMFYPMQQVGFYTQAYKYQDTPFAVLSDTFRSVSMLILSEINQQTERLHRVVAKLMKTMSFLSFPIAVILILIAEPLFVNVFGEKWLPSVPYFQILCLGGAVSPFTFILNELFIAKERADFFLSVEIVKRIILIALIIAFFKQGIAGLAVSWVVYMYITLIISLFLSKKLIAYSLWNFIRDVIPYVTLSLVAVLAAYFASYQISNGFLQMLAAMAVMGAVYLILCRVFNLEMTTEINQFIASKRPKNSDNEE